MLTFTARITGCAAIAVAATACGASPNTASSDERIPGAGSYRLPESAEARLFLNAAVARNEAATAFYPDRNLGEALPNTVVSVNGRPGQPASSGLVVGNVVSVEPGQAFAAERDAATGTPVSFDSDNATWRIVTVTVKAEHYVRQIEGVMSDDTQEVKLGVVVTGANYEDQMQGIRDLGNVAILLDTDHTHRVNGADIPAVARNGSLFGDIDSAGGVAFPAIATDSPKYGDTLDSVAELMAAATAAPTTLHVTVSDGIPSR